jgi:hypothetical protein
MTPKEKAKELIEMFIFFASNEGTTEDGFIYSDEMQMFNAKQCALIAVDEILNECLSLKEEFWEEIRKEIENL